MSARHEHELSLNDLIGNRLVVDVYGYAGDGGYSFRVTRVLLSDGTSIDIEGCPPFLHDLRGVVTMPEVSP